MNTKNKGKSKLELLQDKKFSSQAKLELECSFFIKALMTFLSTIAK